MHAAATEGTYFGHARISPRSGRSPEPIRIKPLLRHVIVNTERATSHNDALQRGFINKESDFSLIDAATHYHPTGVVRDKLHSYKVGSFESDVFDWGNLKFPQGSDTRKTETMCKKYGIKESLFKPLMWQKYLFRYSNTDYATWIIRFILQGAPLGFTKSRETQIVSNDGLTKESSDAIEEKIREEDKLGRSHIFGPRWPRKE